MSLLGANHARGDRSEDENALEAFAENKNPDIKKCDRRAGMRLHWIRRAMRGKRLPYNHRDDTDCSGDYSDYNYHTPRG